MCFCGENILELFFDEKGKITSLFDLPQIVENFALLIQKS